MSDDNWLDDLDSSPVIQNNKQTLTEDTVLEAVDRITSKAVETGYSEGQLDTNIIMMKLEREFNTSLIQFRTAIAAKLAIVKAISPPRPSKAGTSLSSSSSSHHNESHHPSSSSRTLFPTTLSSSTTAATGKARDSDSDNDSSNSSIDSDVPILQQIAQRQAKYLAAQQKQKEEQSTLASSSTIRTPAKESKSKIIDILDTDEEAELLLSQQSTAAQHPVSTVNQTSSTNPAGTAKGSVKLASSLPLILPKQPKRNRSTMLVQIEDNNLELSGDIGAIGRLTTLPNEGLILDLKGHQYGGTIVPCSSFMVVGFQPKEARVEAIISDFVQVEHFANMIDSLSGSLTSGTIDPVLLQFQDVDGDETAALAKKYGNDEDDEEDGGGGGDDDTEQKKGSKKKVAGKRKRSSDDDDSGSDDDYQNDDDDDSENDGKTKRKGAKSSSAENNPSIKIYGRAVKVGKKKKSKKKTAAKGGRKKGK